jgi:hypothetical protein
MFFVAGRSITWGSGFCFVPQMALAYRLDAISKWPTKLSISSANPPPTPPRNVSARIKNITHGVLEIIGA